jgi:hypothetical protein
MVPIALEREKEREREGGGDHILISNLPSPHLSVALSICIGAYVKKSTTGPVHSHPHSKLQAS